MQDYRNSRHSPPANTREEYELTDGSRVAVIGGGPAGSFFSIFLSDMAERLGREVEIDIYEPRDFLATGPAACNMCGGIISESLVQNLATEGINLPGIVVQRGIDSYMLHMDAGSVRIETPLREMRIGAVHRGAGPRDLKEAKWQSFDGFLQKLAVERGAKVKAVRVDRIERNNGKPTVLPKDGEAKDYDLIAIAAGVNLSTPKMFDEAGFDYQPPETTRTFIREFHLGEEDLRRHLGSSMHVFLLSIPGIEFAAVIPKGDYASICLLGEGIDKEKLQAFLDSPQVRACMPEGWESRVNSCQCSPKMNVRGVAEPFGDRIVLIGDAGVTRLYKDGIGAAYRTAKAAATTAMFGGVSAANFRKGYFPVCKRIERDNSLGRLVFRVTEQIQVWAFARRAVLRMLAREQRGTARSRRMSMVMWDLFTGSATYREIFLRTIHPWFVLQFAADLLTELARVPFLGRRRAQAGTAASERSST